MSNFSYSDELYHHGIKGQKWGIRRYQNVDGTRTPEGKLRYNKKGEARDYAKQLNNLDRGMANARYTASDKSFFSSKEAKAEARKSLEQGQKEVDKLIKEIQKKGYEVESKDFFRAASTGEAVAKSMAFTVAGSLTMAALGIPIYMLHTEGVEGKKYRVGKVYDK